MSLKLKQTPVNEDGSGLVEFGYDLTVIRFLGMLAFFLIS